MLNRPLARDVAIVIVAKLMLVIAAAVFVFGPSQRPKIDVSSVETRVLGPRSDLQTDALSNTRNSAP